MKKKLFCPWSFIGAVIFGLCTVIGKHFFDFGTAPGSFGGLDGMAKYVPVIVVLILVYYQILYSLFNRSCLLYTSPSPRDRQKSRMPSSA